VAQAGAGEGSFACISFPAGEPLTGKRIQQTRQRRLAQGGVSLIRRWGGLDGSE